MQSKAPTIAAYISELAQDKRAVIEALDRLVRSTLNGAVGTMKFGMPTYEVTGPMIALMRFMPAWSEIKGIAHTLPYDEAVLEGTRTGTGLPTDRWARISAPILSIAGGKSPEPMKNAMKALADGLATARYQELPGQTHMVKAKVLGPVIAEFFGAQSPASHDAQSKAAA